MTNRAEALAKALEKLIAAGDAYMNPDNNDVLLMLQYGDADEQARAALSAYNQLKKG